MEETADENASSKKLRQQLQSILERSSHRKTRDKFSTLVQTEICELIEDDNEVSPIIAFLRGTALMFAKKVDDMRKNNLYLENSIDNSIAKLNNLKMMNERLLEKIERYEELGYLEQSDA